MMKYRIGQAVEFVEMPRRVGYIQGIEYAVNCKITKQPDEGFFYQVKFDNDPLTYIFDTFELIDAGEADAARKLAAADRKQEIIDRRQNNTVRGRRNK